MKTREEVEKLKQNWLSDACWDIETTEGFEDFKDELLKFRLDTEKKNEERRKKKFEGYASKYCPMSFAGTDTYGKCLVEKCAWWCATDEHCAIFHLRQLGDIAEASRLYTYKNEER